jgi:hypothetical protein
MHLQDLKALLQQGVTRVVFLKADESERTMLATTHPSAMPPAPPNPAGGTKPMADGHLLVWDTEAKALRSFNSARLLEEPVLIEVLDRES